MDLGSLFLILALALAVTLFVSQPFLKQPSNAITGSAAAFNSNEHSRSALQAERDRVLDALQELDFDQALGKIPAEDYPIQRGSLIARGVEVLRELDGVDPRAANPLEDAIADRWDANIGAVDPLEDQIAARRRAREEKSVGFCPKCGHPLQKSDRFCPKCGTPL